MLRFKNTTRGSEMDSRRRACFLSVFLSVILTRTLLPAATAWIHTQLAWTPGFCELMQQTAATPGSRSAGHHHYHSKSLGVLPGWFQWHPVGAVATMERDHGAGAENRE